MSVISSPPPIPSNIAEQAIKEWTDPHQYFEKVPPVVQKDIRKESIEIWESREPRYFARSMDRTIWMLIMNATYPSPRVETYRESLISILNERGAGAIVRSIERHSSSILEDINVSRDILKNIALDIEENEKMMRPEIIREISNSKRDSIYQKIRNVRDSIRAMKSTLKIQTPEEEEENDIVPNTTNLLKQQFKKISEEIANSSFEKNNLDDDEPSASLRARVKQSSLELEAIKRKILSQVRILESELSRPARLDNIIVKCKRSIESFVKKLELLRKQESKRQEILESLTHQVMVKTRQYHNVRTSMTPEQLKRLDPKFQHRVRDEQIQDMQRIEKEMKRVMSSYHGRRNEIVQSIRKKIRKKYADEIRHILNDVRGNSNHDVVALWQNYDGLAQRVRYQASEKLRNMKESLYTKTKECKHLSWKLRERVVQLENAERDQVHMIEGLRGVKRDREVRRRRLDSLRKRKKQMWIARELDSERYVSLLLKCCAHLPPRSDIINIMKFSISKLKSFKEDPRRRRKYVML
jgi:hypothetical protein